VAQTNPSPGTLSLDARLDQLQRYLPSHLTEKILANRGRLEGERKLVTVLFADLVGYTSLSEQLGEEAMFALMDDLYEAFIHDVHRYEGTVNELTGDGLIAFFGAPLAVEQAPQRPCIPPWPCSRRPPGSMPDWRVSTTPTCNCAWGLTPVR
jgi:class 3 adenylate cyclase